MVKWTGEIMLSNVDSFCFSGKVKAAAGHVRPRSRC